MSKVDICLDDNTPIRVLTPGAPICVLYPDGSIDIDPKYNVTEVAHRFWAEVTSANVVGMANWYGRVLVEREAYRAHAARWKALAKDLRRRLIVREQQAWDLGDEVERLLVELDEVTEDLRAERAPAEEG